MQRFILLIAPLVIAVITSFIRSEGFVLDFYITPLIFFIAQSIILRLPKVLDKNTYVFLFGLVLIITVLYPLLDSNAFGYFNAIFYLVYTLLAIWYQKKKYITERAIIMLIMIIIPLTFYFTKTENYIFNKINTGTFTGIVKKKISSPIIVINQQGDTISLKVNKNYIIDFWFVGCAPCVEYFPEWERISTQNISSGYEFLSICMPLSAEDSDSIMFNYPLQYGHHFEVHKALPGMDMQLGLRSYPTTMVIKNNVIVFQGIPEQFDLNYYLSN